MICVVIQDMKDSEKTEKVCYHDYGAVSQLTVAKILTHEAERDATITEPEQAASMFSYDPFLQTATGFCSGKQYTFKGVSQFNYHEGRKAYTDGYAFEQNPWANKPNGAMTISAMNWDRGWAASERYGFMLNTEDDEKTITRN